MTIAALVLALQAVTATHLAIDEPPPPQAAPTWADEFDGASINPRQVAARHRPPRARSV